jgi:hypothetical protein
LNPEPLQMLHYFWLEPFLGIQKGEAALTQER